MTAPNPPIMDADCTDTVSVAYTTEVFLLRNNAPFVNVTLPVTFTVMSLRTINDASTAAALLLPVTEGDPIMRLLIATGTSATM
jgi:hypothetical protein